MNSDPLRRVTFHALLDIYIDAISCAVPSLAAG